MPVTLNGKAKRVRWIPAFHSLDVQFGPSYKSFSNFNDAEKTVTAKAFGTTNAKIKFRNGPDYLFVKQKTGHAGPARRSSSIRKRSTRRRSSRSRKSLH